jgi:hypothetical protein
MNGRVHDVSGIGKYQDGEVLAIGPIHPVPTGVASYGPGASAGEYVLAGGAFANGQVLGAFVIEWELNESAVQHIWQS